MNPLWYTLITKYQESYSSQQDKTHWHPIILQNKLNPKSMEKTQLGMGESQPKSWWKINYSLI